MTRIEEEYAPRTEITDPVIQVVNHGLYEYRSQLADYFKQLTSDIEPQSSRAQLVSPLFFTLFFLSFYCFCFFHHLL